MRKVFLSIVSVLLLAGAPASYAVNTGVPSECEDVMLQAFYWDSYNSNASSTKYGRTKWIDLMKDTAAINANFDVVWFPPSAGPTGCGVGYSAKQYSNQDSDWGTKSKLTELITALHKGNTKVLADVVLNHRGSGTTWCTFLTDNFGTYGTYTLTQKQIVSNDECFTNSSSNCYGAAASDRGAYDTGDNFDGARDLDHQSTVVQNWAKAYTQWLLGSMKYDGFRYDMTLGFHGRYLSMYNEAANPYISVSELWESISRQKQGIVTGSYGKLNKNKTFEGLRKHGLERYSVTFIDNHDTFDRGTAYGDNQFSGSDLTNATTKDQILQATAYQLMMPGIPCLFWPYWKSYQNEVNELIAIRKQVGIHSESKVLEETSGQYQYSATVQGHRGQAVVRVGKYRSTTLPEGFQLAVDGGSAGQYTVYVKMNAEGMDEVNGRKPNGESTKFIRDGKLYIRIGEKTYDILGNEMK